MTTSPGWQLMLLGTPRLVAPDGQDARCDGKTLALLTYLAVEGPTTRSRLVALLWPDTHASQSRNNLVHLLRRARGTYGADLAIGPELLTLSPDVRCDLHASAPDQAASAELPPGGTLLDGVDYDDLPDFADWLLATRENLETRRREAFREALDRLQDEGAHAAAVGLAERWLTLDPLSESAWRRLMQMHYAAGDRPAALRAYHRCKDTLQRELGTQPSERTARLARDIDLGVMEQPMHDGRLPVTVLRPPHLIAREDAWTQMEEAWTAGRQIFVTGEPGVGKTRLAQDFLRSRGPWLHLPSHPGDRDVPFASAARNARARLAAARNVELPDWVRRELSRLLPELHGAEDLPPLMADTDRRTFFLAHLEMARRTSSAYVATLNDDVHDYDAATIDLGAFLFAHAAAQDGPGTMPRFVSVYRLGELSAAQQTAVDRLVDTGVAVRVTLTPWDRGDVVTLLRDLPLPPGVSEQSAVDELAARLHASSGGNPQFVLEAVRHLLETGDEFLSVPNGDPGSFAALVQRRLARLSSRALHAARAAAVLGSDFTLEHVSDVLGLPIVDTASAWEELDAAQIVVGESFGHDLVAQAVLTGTPDPTRRLLHRAAARVLLQYGAPPARVARHWQQGGDDRQSAEWWIGAARAAEATLRPVEAAEFLEHAANAFETSGQPERAEEARRERARILHSEAAGA